MSDISDSHGPATMDRTGSPRRLALFGLFGSGNLGNDGSLQAMLDFLRSTRPDAEITCICADPQKVRDTFHIPAIRIGWQSAAGTTPLFLERFLVTRKLLQLAHTIRNVRNFDALIVPGTGILDDYSERPWGFPASLFSWCAAARFFGKKVAFVSVGAGPIRHPVSRWLMKSAASMAQYRSYRDTISKEFMQSIGFDAKYDQVYPDIAFKLPAPAPARSEAVSAPRPLTVGVGLMSYYGWRGDAERGANIYHAYIQKMAQFVAWLLNRGHSIRLLIGEATDQKAITDVLKAVTQIHPTLAPCRITAEPADSLQHLICQIAETDVVVATRFHNVVCSLKLGKPTISIGYAKKNDVLMADVGLGHFCQHIENLNVDVLVAQFQTLLSEHRRYSERVLEAARTYDARLHEQDKRLAADFL